MDGCIYEYTQEFVDGCQAAAVKAIIEFVPELADEDYQVMHDKAWASYLKHGSSITAFARKYGLDHDQMNAVYHKFLQTSYVNPLEDLPSAFEDAVNGGHKICLATHSHMNFASRLIQHLKLHQTFNAKANMLTLEQVGNQYMKDKSPKMVLEAAKIMGEDIRNLALIEDTARNLIPAKQAGATTVLIHWGKKIPDVKPPHVDYMFKSPVDVLKAVHR